MSSLDNILRRVNWLWKHRHTHDGDELDDIQVQIDIIRNSNTIGTHVAPFSKTGVLPVFEGAHKLVFQHNATVLSVTAAVGTAPTGADMIVDLNLNGVTMFTEQADRPTIPAGSEVSAPAVPAVTFVSAGGYLTVDVDQVGSTVPGADLTVSVEWEG